MIYLFEHPTTQEVVEIEQLMCDDHIFFDEKGLEWKRVWTIPNAFVTEKVDPYSVNQFMNKTSGGLNQPYKDLLDRSKELSSIRAEKNGGVDPIKEKSEKEYSKKRKGKQVAKSLKDIKISI